MRSATYLSDLFKPARGAVDLRIFCTHAALTSASPVGSSSSESAAAPAASAAASEAAADEDSSASPPEAAAAAGAGLLGLACRCSAGPAAGAELVIERGAIRAGNRLVPDQVTRRTWAARRLPQAAACRRRLGTEDAASARPGAPRASPADRSLARMHARLAQDASLQILLALAPSATPRRGALVL